MPQYRCSVPNGNTKNLPLYFAFSRLRSHFALMFCEGGKLRNVQTFITLMHSHCFTHSTFLWRPSRRHRRGGLLKLPITIPFPLPIPLQSQNMFSTCLPPPFPGFPQTIAIGYPACSVFLNYLFS